jgi:hypothetical protein
MIAAHSELQSWISDNHDIDDVKSPEYYAAVDRFHNAFSHVLLVGSKEVRGEAEQMYRYVRHDLGGAYEDLDVPTTGRGITVRMVQEALRKEYNDFLEVARADISSGGN